MGLTSSRIFTRGRGGHFQGEEVAHISHITNNSNTRIGGRSGKEQRRRTKPTMGIT
jgi:CTP synthase (UTP-ammonia lyase)